MQQEHVEVPRVINTDKYAAYPKAIEELQESEELPKTTEHWQVKYPNNLLEQDRRFTKRQLTLFCHARIANAYRASQTPFSPRLLAI